MTSHDDRESLEFDLASAVINDDVIEHHCFGCGSLNPIGLQLRFRAHGPDGVWAEFTPTRAHEGYLGIAHGGILATILDEAMSWAVTRAGDLGVTGRMNIAFRRPAQIGSTLRATGRVITRQSRTIHAAAEIRDTETGALIADAEARFVRVSKDQAAAWNEQYGAGIVGTAFGDAAERNADR
jgi:uncharacterized protein (TIGR00369 family)